MTMPNGGFKDASN